MIWDIWWVWVAVGLALAILEIFAPGFVFLASPSARPWSAG